MASVDTSDFVRTHGKNPKGTGQWAFRIAGQTVFIHGKYAEAKRQAITTAKRKQAQTAFLLG